MTIPVSSLAVKFSTVLVLSCRQTDGITDGIPLLYIHATAVDVSE